MRMQPAPHPQANLRRRGREHLDVARRNYQASKHDPVVNGSLIGPDAAPQQFDKWRVTRVGRPLAPLSCPQMHPGPRARPAS